LNIQFIEPASQPFLTKWFGMFYLLLYQSSQSIIAEPAFSYSSKRGSAAPFLSYGSSEFSKVEPQKVEVLAGVAFSILSQRSMSITRNAPGRGVYYFMGGCGIDCVCRNL
jgi:hypothetical protein